MTNPFKFTPIFEWNITSEKRINVNQGGTSSTKTYSLMQVLGVKALQDPGCIITVVGQDIPNLKAGPYRDFNHIAQNF